MGEFAVRHAAGLERILAGVRDLGRFPPAVMAIADELGYLREHEISPAGLLLWSGGIEACTPEIGAPATMRRMAVAGADLQLAHLVEALVGTAVQRAPETPATAVTAVLDDACALVAGPAYRRTVREVLLTWRVGFLPGVLMPTSASPEWIKQGFRAYARALEPMTA
uniref:TetR family transcriptional regulator n=1 Tax=Streptomyces sp. NBC_00049 TaxID=2903617 RepID=A0AAU2JRP3_9ACTN